MHFQRPRLEWKGTFADLTAARRWADDYRARDPEHPRMYARTYQLPRDRRWLWFVGEHENIAFGTGATLREAKLAAEAAWFAYRDRVNLSEIPVPRFSEAARTHGTLRW